MGRRLCLKWAEGLWSPQFHYYYFLGANGSPRGLKLSEAGRTPDDDSVGIFCTLRASANSNATLNRSIPLIASNCHNWVGYEVMMPGRGSVFESVKLADTISQI